MHSSVPGKPSCPSVARPQAYTWPLSFNARVWASPHDTATIFWASSAPTCSKKENKQQKYLSYLKARVVQDTYTHY